MIFSHVLYQLSYLGARSDPLIEEKEAACPDGRQSSKSSSPKSSGGSTAGTA